MPENTQYLFLGDYVDRGHKQLETICLLFACKITFPQTFHLLRGNHECVDVCSQYGFFEECVRVFNRNIFNMFIGCFDVMPVAATINNRMFCVHGGLSPELSSLDQIKNIMRPAKVAKSGLLCDLLWSDPDVHTDMWNLNLNRGISFKFGAKVVADFLKKFQFECIVRAHEVVPHGYQFFAGLSLVTLFSSTNFGLNNAVYMSIDENLHCIFHNLFDKKI